MIRHLLLPIIAAIPVAAADYAIDDDHSFALFRIQHMGAGFTWGRFDDVAGDLAFDPANPAAAKVAITIKAASVSTGVPDMEKHLRTPDLLDVKQFPTLGFTSKSWAKQADGTYLVSGDLTIHGVTKPITATVVHTGSGKHLMNGKDLIGFETTFAINRHDYGVSYGKGAIGDEVRITLAVEGIRK
jgi:polyisoprenoid-binding protein YceI